MSPPLGRGRVREGVVPSSRFPSSNYAAARRGAPFLAFPPAGGRDTSNSEQLLVRDMLDHAKEAVEMASEYTFDDLSARACGHLRLPPGSQRDENSQQALDALKVPAYYLGVQVPLAFVAVAVQVVGDAA